MIIYHEVDNKKKIIRVQMTKNKMFKISLRRDFDEFEGDNKTQQSDLTCLFYHCDFKLLM